MTEQKQVLCASCKCALQGPANPQLSDMLVCPICGNGDTVDVVNAEVGNYIQEQMSQAIHKAFTNGIGTTRSFKVTSDFQPKGGHRFIVDLAL